MKAKQIKPADRVANVRYAIRDVIVWAEEVARSGKKMLYLNIGDPNKFDHRTPDHIVEATCGAIRENLNSYAPSPGIAEAREAVEAEARRKGISNIRDVFITTGVSEAIEVCFAALVDPGDNLLVPSPSYPTYNGNLTKLGVEPREYYLDEGNNWQPDVSDIAAKIDQRTRGIVIINPNNPTGSLYTVEVLKEIVGLARKHNLLIFSDEIYDKLILDEREHVSTASLDEDAPVITLNGLSKNYLVPGFRIGWGVISGREKGLAKYIGAVNQLLRLRLSANHPEQWAIKPALEGDQSHLIEFKEKLTRRRDITVEMLNGVEGISCVKPEGAFYAFPRLHFDGSDEDFVRGLLEETGVVVVPGSGFGQPPGTRHFRVVFLAPEEVLREAYGRIGDFFGKHRKV